MDEKLQSSLKPIVNHNKYWNPLYEYFEIRIQETLRTIEQTEDVNALFKLKGEIKAYRKMQQLQAEVLKNG